MKLKIRLSVMNFLQFAVWGAYLTCMGIYLSNAGLGSNIGWFYAVQGIVSIFMPAIMGIIADRWIPAQRLLGICHLVAGLFMLACTWYGATQPTVEFGKLFALYTISVAFYMPTLALSNSVAYCSLTKAGMDTVSDFPPIRVFGTVGFICMMWFVDLLGFKNSYMQFAVSGVVSLVLFVYSFTLPHCPTAPKGERRTLADSFGLKAFKLFRNRKMAIFFIFSMLLGVSLQITNGYATPFIDSFNVDPQYTDTFGVRYPVILYSISQFSETFCILLIPFFMKRYGIKQVMLIAMFAWVLRFSFLGLGNPGSGVWLFILSMIIYGVAFDFFNISGSLFVDKSTDPALRSSAQGIFMLMTNGIGATLGSLGAQAVVNAFTHSVPFNGQTYTVGNWNTCWFIFAAFSLVVGVLFALMFRPQKTGEIKK